MDVTDADQDSDSIYTTNQPQIVEHAKNCQNLYPTIVNNIPKDSNTYDNTMEDFAKLDNKLAASQLDIGESSNLAQLAQTYDYSFGDQKYKDYVCILSVLAQIAIDSAKRLFDVDVGKEIRRMKKDMDVEYNKYPAFWKIIRRDFKEKNINYNLICPMSYLYNLKLDQFRSKQSTIPIQCFIKKEPLHINRKTCKRVEDLIYDFSLRFYESEKKDDSDYLLLRQDFNNLISSIQKTTISKNYQDFMCWILDRIFIASPQLKSNQYKIKNRMKKNRSIIIKTLFMINSKTFLNSFSPK